MSNACHGVPVDGRLELIPTPELPVPRDRASTSMGATIPVSIDLPTAIYANTIATTRSLGHFSPL
jgi:hypothetical protein